MKNNFVDKTASLIPEARAVILDKATEHPFSGAYNETVAKGSYLCRRCGLALFRAEHQFHSGCGWPSFDQELVQAVVQAPDEDGQRTEILCQRCAAHLGHVFKGEYMTSRNIRHCVNALALDFVPDDEVLDTQEVIVAGGCFWGVEYWLKQVPGVLKVESGYIGGQVDYPGYEDVCRGDSGHYEAVRVVFDGQKTDDYQVLKRFFEIHDPTQRSGQGPDVGAQYRSAVFYYDNAQRVVAEQLIHRLQAKGFDVVTALLPVQTFWPAEDEHQDYYTKHQKAPYCHVPVERF